MGLALEQARLAEAEGEVPVGAVLVEVGIQMEGTRLVFMSAIAAVLFVFLMILYFRLLGRLMWFTQSARRKVEESSPV